MAANLKKLFTNPASSSSLMLLCGIVAVLGALAVSVVIFQRWDELGVRLGSKSLVGIILCSVVGFLLAGGSGIWALLSVDKLEGFNSLKCTVAFLLDAVALALLMAFIAIAYYLRPVG